MVKKKKPEEKIPEEAPDWLVVLLGIFLLVLLVYPLLVEFDIVDPYANQRIEMNFTIRSVKPFEDPRWTEDRWLLSTYGRGVFFLEGNFTGDQLIKGASYRIIYKTVQGVGDLPFYHVFTMEHIG